MIELRWFVMMDGAKHGPVVLQYRYQLVHFGPLIGDTPDAALDAARKK